MKKNTSDFFFKFKPVGFPQIFILQYVIRSYYRSTQYIDIMFLKTRSLCDIKQSGKLNAEQFALAMWFIQKKVKSGIDPPLTLTPEMVPPSMRSQVAVSVTLEIKVTIWLLFVYYNFFIH